MADNPLSGISIPSLKGIAEEVVERMGEGVIDLRNPMQRQRLRDYIERSLEMSMQFGLERAIQKATERAVAHVFRVMRDADYQEKRRKLREIRAKNMAENKKRSEDAKREARIDYTRRQLDVSKATVQ